MPRGRGGVTEELASGLKLKGGREGAMQTPEGRAFQGAGTARAKALRWTCAWHVQGAARGLGRRGGKWQKLRPRMS